MWITRVHFYMGSSSTSVLPKCLSEMVHRYEIESVALRVVHKMEIVWSIIFGFGEVSWIALFTYIYSLVNELWDWIYGFMYWSQVHWRIEYIKSNHDAWQLYLRIDFEVDAKGKLSSKPCFYAQWIAFL